MENKEFVEGPNHVKVVFNDNFNALYFSRNNIPYGTDHIYKHIGVYGFTKDTLSKIKKLSKTEIEEYESLEQLRWINNGIKIRMEIIKNNTIEINTKEEARISISGDILLTMKAGVKTEHCIPHPSGWDTISN